ncbi:MAG: bifunctional ornithine acetyltransferase/N-acetylglutamate synthase, partial [Phenylobacterium sp.]
MTRKPTPPGKTPGSRRSASKPVEAVGQTLERALDPLASAIKRAALRRADRQSRAFDEPAAAGVAPASPAKGALPVSPLAVPFPRIPPIDGVELATGRAGFYKHEREDLLVMRFAEGTSVAGVFTRHGVGSAPVDWCRRALAQSQGEGARALVVNAGCANSFTGKPGADAARRVASAVAKRFDCRQRDVMIASTGVIGVLLDDAKITQRLPEVETALAADGWAGAARAIMTTDTFPKGAFAEAEI